MMRFSDQERRMLVDVDSRPKTATAITATTSSDLQSSDVRRPAAGVMFGFRFPKSFSISKFSKSSWCVGRKTVKDRLLHARARLLNVEECRYFLAMPLCNVVYLLPC
jgi:hypothetical protein